MDILMAEYGVSYGQTAASTEIQYLNSAWVQFGQANPPNPILPGLAVIANVSLPVEQWSPL